MIKIGAFFAYLLLNAFCFAQEKTQIALIQADGATVYSEPNFDSQMIGHLKSGQKVRASQKSYSGVAGFGSFYKIFFKKGRIGYIADNELIPEYTRVGKRQIKQKNPEYDDFQAEKNERDPIFFTRYFGLAVGIADFSEKFGGQTFRAGTLLYGLKLTGPNILFDGPPLDINILFHIGAPSYYSSFTNGTAKGFMSIADFHIIFPVFETRNNLIHVGAGPLFIYTNFQMTFLESSFDSEELRFGASIAATYSRRFGRFVARAEAKYYFEKTQYFGYFGSFQMEY
jgi:hypothetical protein